MEMKFAAFIMTYNRSHLIVDAIKKIQEQTQPPQKILIVDNSEDYKTKEVIELLKNPKVEYFRVGYNSGPAGASFFGLKKLAEENFDWILWMDDDDLPKSNDLIERIFKFTLIERENRNVGIIGAVGSDFNFSKGELIRITNDELLKGGLLDVYCIAGGMLPIVNGNVIRKNILPDPSLFFGFEELDFCLRVREAGFKIIVPAEIMKERRMLAGRWDLNRTAMSNLGKLKYQNLWRQYYSVRNLTYIFSHKRMNVFMLIRFFLKYSIKSLFSFKRGWAFGLQCSYCLMMGFKDGLVGKMGLVVKPSLK